MHGHHDASGPELERYEDGEDSPTGPQRSPERELGRYDEDEIATAPWPPAGA